MNGKSYSGVEGPILFISACTWSSCRRSDRHGVSVINPVALHPMNRKDDVLVDFLVHRELACLAKRTLAPIEVTFERFLLCMDVGVLL